MSTASPEQTACSLSNNQSFSIRRRSLLCAAQSKDKMQIMSALQETINNRILPEPNENFRDMNLSISSETSSVQVITAEDSDAV
jgi:hypothetical protein